MSTPPLLSPANPWPPQAGNVYQCDALLLMAEMARQGVKVDAIITDLPYGTTACSWDTVIPFAPMWAEVKRVLNPRGVFVTTASQPFTSALVMSNPRWFKYEWIWVKTVMSFFQHARNAPLRKHENVLVFSGGVINHESLTDNRMNYYPQITTNSGVPYRKKAVSPNVRGSGMHHASKSNLAYVGNIQDNKGERYPSSVLCFPNGNYNSEHPTQKPVALYRYLIETYTQPGELVLDFCCGSGTTAVAAFQCGRRFIAGDTDAGYVEIARRRLQTTTPDMFAAAS